MAYYNTCPHCGAHLDPGERCDCAQAASSEEVKEFTELIQQLTPEELTIVFNRMVELLTQPGEARTA